MSKFVISKRTTVFDENGVLVVPTLGMEATRKNRLMDVLEDLYYEQNLKKIRKGAAMGSTETLVLIAKLNASLKGGSGRVAKGGRLSQGDAQDFLHQAATIFKIKNPDLSIEQATARMMTEYDGIAAVAAGYPQEMLRKGTNLRRRRTVEDEYESDGQSGAGNAEVEDDDD
jgi:ABC-type branched-subunit amino acid transport system substrate-binding protein